jgi:hypothetical protein
LSFSAKGGDSHALETDFMMFYRNAAFWERQTEWVFGECKTFNKFKQGDIDRMQTVAESFPNSVLVFATLADDFSPEEKELLIPFVKATRAYGRLDRPRNALDLRTPGVLGGEDWQHQAMGWGKVGADAVGSMRSHTVYIPWLGSLVDRLGHRI